MADKQYEYRIDSLLMEVAPGQPKKTVRIVWFRSTNYVEFSPYGWDTMSTTYPASDKELIAAVKQFFGLGDCEFIEIRPTTNTNMTVSG